MRAIGYLIPEFPGQTHIWMWREITHLREWGAPIRIYSTRPPGERDRARHAFADVAARETVFLWPRPLHTVLGSILWAVLAHPIGFLRCVRLGFRLPVDTGPAWRRVLPLLVPACVLARDVVRANVGLLHCQSAKNSAILAMLVRRLVGVPYSLTINANLGWWGGAMREKLHEAEFTVTHAQWILDEVRRTFPDIPSDRTLRASVGVDTRRWTPRDAAVARPETPFRVVTVGRLHPAKAHDSVIRAVGILIGEGRSIRLRVVGGGPDEPNLRALVDQLGLATHVSLIGSVSEDRVLEEVRDADVFVLASASEGLGVVFMEAMACGVPGIGARGSGVDEVVTHGKDGLLVEPGSMAGFVAAMRSLMDDPTLRARLSEAARGSAVERFDSRLGARILFERFASPAK